MVGMVQIDSENMKNFRRMRAKWESPVAIFWNKKLGAGGF